MCTESQAKERYPTITQRTRYGITAAIHSVVTTCTRGWNHEITCSADPSGWSANHGPDVNRAFKPILLGVALGSMVAATVLRTGVAEAASSPNVVGQKYSAPEAPFPVPDTRSWYRTPSAIRSHGPTASSPASRTGRCLHRRTPRHPQPTRRCWPSTATRSWLPRRHPATRWQAPRVKLPRHPPRPRPGGLGTEQLIPAVMAWISAPAEIKVHLDGCAETAVEVSVLDADRLHEGMGDHGADEAEPDGLQRALSARDWQSMRPSFHVRSQWCCRG